MTGKERFVKVMVEDSVVVHEISLNGSVWHEYTSVEDVVDKLNEQYETIHMWVKGSEKITKLFKENTKPTCYDCGRAVYLDIDSGTKRCKYERTVICDKCAYFSSYFLDCRLMMEDYQYKKALELGLVVDDG